MEHDARGALSESSASSLREIVRGPFLRVTMANFFFFLCFASFFLLPKHLHDLGAGKDRIGDIMAVFGLSATPLAPLVGSLVDRYQRRPFFLGGAALMWIASIGFALVHTLSPVLYVLRILQGVAFACAFTAATTLAADLAPPARRAQALGLFGVFTLITHGLGVTVAEQIETRWGFTALFFIGSSFALVAGWLFLKTPETGLHHGEAKTASLFSIVSNPAIYPSVVVSLVAGSGFGTALTFVPVLGEALRIGHVSIFFVSYMTAAVLVRVVGGRLADVFGRRAVAIPSLAIFALALAGLGRVENAQSLALVGFLFGAGHGLLYPALNALVVDGTRVENRGKAMALYNAAFNAGVTGGNVVFGRVAEAYGYDKMFAVVGLTVLGVLIFFWRKSVPGT